MTVRTCVRKSTAGWQQVRDELLNALADREVLMCAGAAGALLDLGRVAPAEKVAETSRDLPPQG